MQSRPKSAGKSTHGGKAKLTVTTFGLGLALAVTGCDPHDNAPEDTRRNVMVFDEGIDTTLPWFQGNVAAARTLDCVEAPESETTSDDLFGGGQGQDWDTVKAAVIAALAKGDESCHLRNGIDALKPFGQDFTAEERARWNRALLDDEHPTELLPLWQALNNEQHTMPFHGTATAGLIAYENSGLRMVLVSRKLSSMEEIAQNLTCLDQASVDLAVRAFSDPDVRAAALASPLPSAERELRALRAAHQVTLVNESFGPLARITIEEALKAAGCSAIDLRAYYQVTSELQRQYERQHPEPGVLFVRAAGNEGVTLDDESDSIDCRPGDPQQVLVGSYGLQGTRSFFSNVGACVDLYAPGDPVVAPLPGNVLQMLEGTSFSAPLVVRHLIASAPQPFSAEGARAALLAERNAAADLPLALFPPELVFDAVAANEKSDRGRTTSALTAAAGVPKADVRSVGARRGIDQAALRRMLRPLRLLSGSPRRVRTEPGRETDSHLPPLLL